MTSAEDTAGSTAANAAEDTASGGSAEGTAKSTKSSSKTGFIVAAVIVLTAALLIGAGFAFGWFERPDHPTTTAPVEPNSRYEGTIKADGAEADVVVRFFDNEEATITSPTWGTYAELTKISDTEYAEQPVVGEGNEGRIWALGLDGADVLTVMPESTARGSEEADGTRWAPGGTCQRTEWDNTDGEEGLAQKGPAAN